MEQSLNILYKQYSKVFHYGWNASAQDTCHDFALSRCVLGGTGYTCTVEKRAPGDSASPSDTPLQFGCCMTRTRVLHSERLSDFDLTIVAFH